LIELRVRFYKEGSKKMTLTHATPPAASGNSPSTAAPGLPGVAGIDVSKAKLDTALACGRRLKQYANDREGHAGLIGELNQLGVKRVGLEATGGYERKLAEALRAAGFEVVVWQPIQMRAYALYRLKRAKSDTIDAAIIALATAELKALRQPPDARLAPLAAHLTMIEQIEEDIARSRIRLELAACEEAKAHHESAVKWLKAKRREELKRLEDKLGQHADLAERLTLVTSIEGIGRRTGLSLIIRMPELGQISREQAASLLGVAPVIHQSGKYKGEEHVEGGRMRPRTALFACAQAAILHNDELKAFYKRLRDKGKHHAVAIMACARKLAIYANTVLKRKTAWQDKPPKKAAA
jgi:transposase